MDLLPPVEPWLHPSLSVRDSPIEGMGLFATAPIEAGTRVAVFGGRLVTDGELEALLSASDRYVDTLSIDSNLNLVLPGRSPLGYGNHSCDPNMWWAGDFALTARRALVPGDEATLDYGTITDAADYVMACRCGSTFCRWQVTGNDWSLPDLQARYGQHWVPALLSRIRARPGVQRPREGPW